MEGVRAAKKTESGEGTARAPFRHACLDWLCGSPPDSPTPVIAWAVVGSVEAGVDDHDRGGDGEVGTRPWPVRCHDAPCQCSAEAGQNQKLNQGSHERVLRVVLQDKTRGEGPG